jgi:hypothetical protein
VSSLRKLQLSLIDHFDASKLTTDDTTFGNNPLFLTNGTLTKCSTIRLHTSHSSSASNLLRVLGIHGCLLSYSRQNGRVRYVILRIPFLWNRALVIEIGIRTFATAGSLISIFRQHLSIRNVVAETSPIMTASCRGDLETIQTLFGNREATPFDITEDGTTPLEVCVQVLLT